MSGSLMDSILGMVSPDMKWALVSRLGESLEGVQSGLNAATAATLSGLDRKAADRAFLGQVLEWHGGATGSPVAASLPAIAASAPRGAAAEATSNFVRMLFGSQQAEVAGAVSQHAGVSVTSGPALLDMSAALVLAYLVERHRTGSLTADSLGSMLRAEAPTLHNYLPARLLPGAPMAVGSIGRRAALTPASATRVSRWMMPLAVAGALLLGGLLVRALSGRRQPRRGGRRSRRQRAAVRRFLQPAVGVGTSFFGQR
jgi:hypothetical protein